MLLLQGSDELRPLSPCFLLALLHPHRWDIKAEQQRLAFDNSSLRHAPNGVPHEAPIAMPPRMPPVEPSLIPQVVQKPPEMQLRKPLRRLSRLCRELRRLPGALIQNTVGLTEWVMEPYLVLIAPAQNCTGIRCSVLQTMLAEEWAPKRVQV